MLMAAISSIHLFPDDPLVLPEVVSENHKAQHTPYGGSGSAPSRAMVESLRGGFPPCLPHLSLHPDKWGFFLETVERRRKPIKLRSTDPRLPAPVNPHA